MSTKTCKHTEGLYHDCDYVEQRLKLIPIAEREASKLYPSVFLTNKTAKFDEWETWSKKWDQAFLVIMDRLYAEEITRQNLIKQNYGSGNTTNNA
jgi:hypothetical protein